MTKAPPPPLIRWCRRICGVAFSIGILLGIAILGMMSYSLVFFETVYENVPMTVERARQIACPIPLPESATNVRFAIYHHWGDNEIYVKFKADTTVCQDWVKTVVAANLLEHPDASSDTTMQRITGKPAVPSWGGIGPLPWFNIGRIVDGMVRIGGTNDPTIWIDDDRGLFYYRITN